MSGINSNNKVVCLDESDDESDGVGEWREVKNKKKERIEKRHASRSGGNDVTVKKARMVSHGGGGAGKKSTLVGTALANLVNQSTARLSKANQELKTKSMKSK